MQIDADRGQYLPDLVVQLVGDSAALIFLSRHQLTRKPLQSLRILAQRRF
ncbi:MAG TPA: hypothetical protein VEL76_41920 [Gemmataceae bacterium]|nr:hypothetical protein [Gemmataceae bacterium]